MIQMSAQMRVRVDRLVLPWGLTNSSCTSVDAEPPPPPTPHTHTKSVCSGGLRRTMKINCYFITLKYFLDLLQRLYCNCVF